MNRFEQLISDCETEIRAGAASLVAKRLRRLNLVRVPNEYRLPLARLCRRAGLYGTGLRLLMPLVLAEKVQHRPPTPSEMSEYAALLIRIGAVSEGIQKLALVDVREAPESLLYRGFGHFGRWEYPEAVELLDQYLRAPLDDYKRLVGQMNLAFAQVESRQHSKAHELLGQILREASLKENRLIQSNCLGLRAQIFMQEGDYKKAKGVLLKAREIVNVGESNDHRFLTKLELITEALASKRTEPLDQLRTLSIAHHDWEFRREAHLYRLKVRPDQRSLEHLFFGTPFQRFRELARYELGMGPSQVEFLLGPADSPTLDVRSGVVDGYEGPTLKCLQVINALLNDFYQPIRTAALFNDLFPSEQFNIQTSPERIRQLLWRTRRWFEREQIPVAIEEDDGFYSLQIKGAFSFRVLLDRPEVDPMSHYFDQLKDLFASNREFRAREAQLSLNVSKSAIREILNSAIAKGLIERFGDDVRSTRYRIINADSPTAPQAILKSR